MENMECTKITGENLKWFSPLLSEEYAQAVKNNTVHAVGAAAGGTACGVLAFTMTPMSINIEYIAVSDVFRRKGAGTAMLRFLCSFADESVTPVLCSFSASGKDDPKYLFFEENENFSVSEEEGFICELNAAALKDIKLPEIKLNDSSISIVPFFSLPKPERNAFWLSLQNHGTLYPPEIADGTDCEDSLCLCARSKGGILSAVFIGDLGEEGFYLSFVWCIENVSAQKQLVALFAELIKRISETKPGGNLTIAAITPASIALVNKLLPERRITARFYSAAWDMEEI
jgi:predicted GNAT family acetyltransferase